ncbi:MAG TPA: transglycosylase domain-containing protein [Chthoniobacteraceae bacterium]|jgi:penicillin-binding protein 1A|nr:transglycosylase domain-containing protein [Chthoniobacteraceae bacterium]
MSWSTLPRARKPFYRRGWVLTLVALFFIVAAGGAGYVWLEMRQWKEKAQTFDYSRLTAMESASVIYDRNNQVLDQLFIQNRNEVPISEISPNLLKAAVGGEDARFYSHDGVDYYGIARALVKNYQAGRTKQGASTLTQQLARNTFVDELPSSDRGYGRKLLEIAVAWEIEKRLNSKEKILELYLNRVFFGGGFYGADAAARGYFDKHAKDLDLSEAATLIGLLKSPNNLSPWRNRQACIEQRNYVLQRMLELKLITKDEYTKTYAQDLIVKNRKPMHQGSYAADLVEQQVKKLVGEENTVRGGYRIYTTIDSALQKKVEASLRDQLTHVEHHEGFDHPTYAQYDQVIRAYRRTAGEKGDDAGPVPEPKYLQGSAVVLDNATGGILALVGGRDFTHSTFNRALYAKRPSGTAFMPLVYAAAFENGLFPGTPVQDAVIDNRQVMIGGTTGILGEWGPERLDNRYEGLISARTALVKSKNAATVRLGNTIGKNLGESLDRLATLSKKAGIESELRKFPATFLGSSEVTLMEMTLANTMFANGGWRPDKAFIIERITDKSGRELFRAALGKQRVLRPTTAYEVHSCLAEVLERGTADKTYTDLGVQRFALGGKTGTAYNFTDVSFIGYSSAVTCGVWAGFDEPRTSIYRGAFSSDLVLPVWAAIMKETFADYKPVEIGTPPGLLRCEICSASGLLATPKCFETIENKETGEKTERRTTYFDIATEAQVPKEACDVHGGVPRTPKETSVAKSQWPRPMPVANLSVHTPVVMKSPTILGDDPYNSAAAAKHVADMHSLNGQRAPLDNSGRPATPEAGPEVQVRTAQPVKSFDQKPVFESVIKLDVPGPIDFNGLNPAPK